MSMACQSPLLTISLNKSPNAALRTYLAYLRLSKALSQYRSSHPTAPVTFTLKFASYQLYPDFSQDGEDKYAWYKKEKYNNSEEKMAMYTKYMGALGRAENVAFDFQGAIANTLHAHRVLHWIQENKSSEATAKCLDCGFPIFLFIYSPFLFAAVCSDTSVSAIYAILHATRSSVRKLHVDGRVSRSRIVGPGGQKFSGG